MSQNIVHPETQCSCWGGLIPMRLCGRRAGSLRKDVVSQQVYVHCLLMAQGRGRAIRSCFYSHTTARYAGCLGTRAPHGCVGGRIHLWEDQVTPLWCRCHLLFDGSWWHCHRSQLPHAADVLGRCLEACPLGWHRVGFGVWGPLELLPPVLSSPLPAGIMQRTLTRVAHATAVTPVVPLLTLSVETCQVPGVGQGGPMLFWVLGEGSWTWAGLHWTYPPIACPGEGTLQWETVGPVLLQKEKVPWYKGEGHPNPFPCPQNPHPLC